MEMALQPANVKFPVVIAIAFLIRPRLEEGEGTGILTLCWGQHGRYKHSARKRRRLSVVGRMLVSTAFAPDVTKGSLQWD